MHVLFCYLTAVVKNILITKGESAHFDWKLEGMVRYSRGEVSVSGVWGRWLHWTHGQGGESNGCWHQFTFRVPYRSWFQVREKQKAQWSSHHSESSSAVSSHAHLEAHLSDEPEPHQAHKWEDQFHRESMRTRIPQHTWKNPGLAVDTCNLSTREEGTRRSPALLNSQPSSTVQGSVRDVFKYKAQSDWGRCLREPLGSTCLPLPLTLHPSFMNALQAQTCTHNPFS